jgi:ABC-type transport system substrate-binding protein
VHLWKSRSSAILSVLLLSIVLLAAQAAPSAERRLARIVVGLPGETDSLDGHEVSLFPNLPIYPQLYDKLVEFDMDMNVVPQLATSWSVSSDALTWTFRLRQGQRFHDGSVVNAEAVKRSFDRLLDEQHRTPHRSWFDMIERVTAPDQSTVVFTTRQPHLFLAHRLAMSPGSIVSPTAVARVDRATFGANPVGSGPYIFKEWVRGRRIVLEKNPNHWLARRLNIDVIEYRPVPDEGSRAIGLETGELDFVSILTPQDAERLKLKPNVAIHNMPNIRFNGVYMNVAKKPFDDARVRQAVSHAIDKRAIVQTFLAGYGAVADSILPTKVWGYKSQRAFDYNPARARQLLTEAGYRNGFSTTMWVPIGSYVNAQQISEAIAGMLRQVGITVRLELMETGRFFATLRSRGPEESTMEMAYYGFGAGTGEPDYSLRLLYHSSQFAPRGSNRQFYSNPEVDALLEIGPSRVSERQRQIAYERIQEIVWKDQPWAYVFFINQAVGANKALKGVTVLPNEVIHFREARLDSR